MRRWRRIAARSPKLTVAAGGLLVSGLALGVAWGIAPTSAVPASQSDAVASDRPDALSAEAVDRPRPVRVVTVVAARPTSQRTYAAVVRARIETETGFRVTGELVERSVGLGDRFGPGDVLARLDPSDLDLQVKAAEAQLVARKAEAVNARAEVERSRALHGKGWSTEQLLDERETALAAADARVEEAEARLAIARNNRGYAELRADVPGVVTAVLAEPGRVLDPGDPVLRVAHTDALEVEAEIPEQNVADLATARLEVTFWSDPDLRLQGRLRELSPIAAGATRTYRARVVLEGAPPTVQLGMTASLLAIREVPTPVHPLPLAALDHQGGEPAVWVVKGGGTLERRPVAVAAYTADDVLVRDGLRPGEQVVTAGVHQLDEGQRVRIWTEPDR